MRAHVLLRPHLLGFLGLALGAASCGAGQGPEPGTEPDSASGRSPGQRPWFTEEASARGLAFTHRSGHAEAYYMPEIMGGGAGFLDAEGDGDLDLYLVQSGDLRTRDARPASALLENDGGGRFRDRTAASGAQGRGYGMGVACGDADGDGDTDLLVTGVGPNTLLLNESARDRLAFREAGAAAGLTLEGWSTSALFADLDRDGDLELFVTRYLEWSPEGELVCMDPLGRPDYCSPKNYKTPARDLLYANDGAGRFQDVSRASGVWDEPGTGLGVAAGDVDGDGWCDVFVANDGMPNHLWRNRGALAFEDVAMLAGCGVDSNGLPKAGMGVVLADLDGDLDLDLLVCNLKGESDSYYQNEGGFFSDRTATAALAALSKPFTRFGVALGDFDQDGWRDLYQANGRVERPTEPPPGDPYAEANLLLRGGSAGRFEEVQPRGGTLPLLSATSRAVCQGDVDGDGDLDLVVVNRDGPAHLLVNQAARGGWVLLAVKERSGADALGAELELELEGRRLRRDVSAAFGYLASHDPRVHVGLGQARELTRVTVRWSDGERERFGPLAAGRVHVLARGQGSPP